MSRFRVLAAGMLTAAVAILASAAPASAHDQLIASSPEAGQRLTAPPESISLEFSAELLTLGDAGATVIVMDGDGRDWASGRPEVTKNAVTIDVAEGMPAAGYEVRWQVVSSDGHPISGVIPFTVGDAEPLAAADDEPDTTAQTREEDPIAQEDRGALRVVLIGAGGAAVAAALFALIPLLRRRRTDADGTGETAP